MIVRPVSLLFQDRNKTSTSVTNLKPMDQETPSESPHKIMEPTRTLTLKMASKQWEMEILSKLDFKI